MDDLPGRQKMRGHRGSKKTADNDGDRWNCNMEKVDDGSSDVKRKDEVCMSLGPHVYKEQLSLVQVNRKILENILGSCDSQETAVSFNASSGPVLLIPSPSTLLSDSSTDSEESDQNERKMRKKKKNDEKTGIKREMEVGIEEESFEKDNDDGEEVKDMVQKKLKPKKEKSAAIKEALKLLQTKFSDTDTSEEDEKCRKLEKTREKERQDQDGDILNRGKKRQHQIQGMGGTDFENDEASKLRSKRKKEDECHPSNDYFATPSQIVDSDEEDENVEVTSCQNNDYQENRHRRNISKILEESHLKTSTQEAILEERHHRTRISEKWKHFDEVMPKEQKEAMNLSPANDDLILDFDQETKERVQVVAFLHTILTSKALGFKTALVLCPYNTVLNWDQEFKIWLEGQDLKKIDIFNMANEKNVKLRKYRAKRWHRGGGVMIIGYNSFRILANPSNKKLKKRHREQFKEAFINPGPDLVVCDEGHILKNEKSLNCRILNQIRTRRRIVLTGTPLQNNLKEYFCMIQFVKPNLLGTLKEFTNRFVNPIENGQHSDSTVEDVKVMKRRSHVLHDLLKDCVQRKDDGELTPFLPPKLEYVVSVRLSPIQIDLYQHYLENYCRFRKGLRGGGASLFSDFQALSRIWTHPKTLIMHEKMMEVKATEEKAQSLWWKKIIEESGVYVEDYALSGKMVLLADILHYCEIIKDKVLATVVDSLVFTQSRLCLDLVEQFLEFLASNRDQIFMTLDPEIVLEVTAETAGANDVGSKRGEQSQEYDPRKWSWVHGRDYFRIDGSTDVCTRRDITTLINNPENHRARLLLISTKAGGMGINLVGANRVVILDTSWNPSNDVQALSRVYRLGQRKQVYVYRFFAKGTMEERMYDRQVTKLSLSCRVVDEQQIERHFNAADLRELYRFDPYGDDQKIPPEELTDEERKAAWEEFEKEKIAPTQTGFPTYHPNTEPTGNLLSHAVIPLPVQLQEEAQMKCKTMMDIRAEEAIHGGKHTYDAVESSATPITAKPDVACEQSRIIQQPLARRLLSESPERLLKGNQKVQEGANGPSPQVTISNKPIYPSFAMRQKSILEFCYCHQLLLSIRDNYKA
ncbi:unnamed protein product [Darwinula stevensoni]|uniref:Transcriptional regulator ATRX n=1 Tax=Darwinula stevensoni TaxID=69355 RepID=A0A7R9AAP2_9CRUS|nr:unnamed protein product [Darwinula stevensoni]CAG0898609.1 unnamed protein product [Darwinula stevensoni]